jgi:ribosomal protein S18 acetylase RimI-like enzyme
MEVRRASVGDAAELAAGMKAVADEGRWLATGPGADPRELEDRFAAAIRDGHAVFAAEEGGRIVGCLGLHPSGTDGVLALGMWLLPEARGRGGGRALMETAMARARGGTAHKVELEVYPDNGRAIALYTAMGFEIDGVRRSHYRRPDGTLRSAVILSALL